MRAGLGVPLLPEDNRGRFVVSAECGPPERRRAGRAIAFRAGVASRRGERARSMTSRAVLRLERWRFEGEGASASMAAGDDFVAPDVSSKRRRAGGVLRSIDPAQFSAESSSLSCKRLELPDLFRVGVAWADLEARRVLPRLGVRILALASSAAFLVERRRFGEGSTAVSTAAGDNFMVLLGGNEGEMMEL